jgi:hypothetical protein
VKIKATIKVWPHTNRILKERQRFNLVLSAAIGWGKTHVGARWHFDRILQNKDSKLSAILAPSYKLLRHLILPRYTEYLTSIGLVQGVHYKVQTSPDLIITFSFGHKVMFLSGDNWKNIVAYDLSHAWIDEPGFLRDEVFYQVVERIRDPKANILQVLFTGVSQGAHTAYFQRFASRDYKTDGEYFFGEPRFKYNEDTLVMFAATQENPILKPQVLDNLKSAYGHNEKLWKAHAFGLFIPFSENTVYDFTDENVTSSPPKIKNGDTLYLTWDFNPGQVAWVASAKKDDYLFCLAENEQMSRTTEEAAQQFVNQFPPAQYRDLRIRVYGDAAGYTRTSQSWYSDFDYVEQTLKKYYSNVKIEAKRCNPLITERIIAMNRQLATNPLTNEKHRLIVAKQCPKLIQSLQITTYNDNGGIFKPKGKDLHTHASDALGYLVHEIMPVIAPVPGGVNLYN